MRHRAVLEVLQVLIQTLDMTVAHPADLATLNLLEPMLAEDSMEALGICWICKVDESIADVAPVVHIHGQVEKIVGRFEAARIDLFHQGVLRVLVGDVTQHHGGRTLVGCRSPHQVRLQVFRLRNALGVVRGECPLRRVCSCRNLFRAAVRPRLPRDLPGERTCRGIDGRPLTREGLARIQHVIEEELKPAVRGRVRAHHCDEVAKLGRKLSFERGRQATTLASTA
mmetsp:Transcript_27456/g.70430  ORF Transcript_27456/g.70430 Transcript_27456/m.70430 type:complete len:226 (+) Transcript_27456:899-1576(+)